MNGIRKILTGVLTVSLLMTMAACREESEEEVVAETPDISDNGLYSPEPEPVPTEEPEQEAERIVISMVGDCTLASSQYNDDFERVIGEDFTWPFAGVMEIVGEDDFTIANLEGSFSDNQLAASTTFYFCAPSSYAQILSEGSVDLATMGNNHTNEFGKAGVEDTKAALDAVGVSHLSGGYGEIYEVQGMKLGVYVSPFGPTAENMKSGVTALKEQGADVIIACAHWGIEGAYHPAQAQISAGRAAIDAGADVVCGSHPHVLQKMEEYGDGYIFYSLGNFSFGGNTNPRDKDTVVAQVSIVQTEDGGYEVEGVSWIPCSLTSKPGVNNYQPIPYEEGTKEYERTMSKLDGTFTGPDLVVDYSHLNGKDDDPAPSVAPETSQPPVTEPPVTPPVPETGTDAGGETGAQTGETTDGGSETTTEAGGETVPPVQEPPAEIPPADGQPVEEPAPAA